MLNPELKRLLQVLQWESKKKFASNRKGLLFTADRGRGLDFKEVRNYQFGDDIRYIDWNVTSRTGELHTKEFFEEKDATIILFIDKSFSMDETKSNSTFQIALFLSLFHIRLGNRLFIISFSDHIFSSGKWFKTETEVLTFFDQLKKQKAGVETNFLEAYQYAYKIHPKYAVSYWLSDFMNLSSWAKQFTFPKLWDQYGIWIKDAIDDIDMPFSLRFFRTISQESKSMKENKSTYNKDLFMAKSIFGKNLIQIDPNAKLHNQILPLFKVHKNV
ncbi:PF01882 family protein [Leptospira yanagawae serovar Saopaulo str. Sao Paulo = ATCC 700523]|uniref:PF01882 family protein n=1 Tax=Leptospira yanagawae serovar Saopaulo str. Sao Paulo = ATCC 700523 TaxID=1249483 RepID=A0A5E8H7Z9_9LEPT|nr:DUF58 domain-containing protein [Leptospira yanagawae]EOQ86837.1 PF01882 family protein [Leptospira yanagawae serovar Saopaulo str. Sao Paulo = ATCC 700523]